MILARAFCQDRHSDLELAFLRMGLPSRARDYLHEKVAHAQLLLTGLGRAESRFLKDLCESSLARGREEFPTFIQGDHRRRPGTALLAGRRDQLERACQEVARDPGLSELLVALQRAMITVPEGRALRLGTRDLLMGSRTLVMAVVNVTPDSFFDGGRYLDPDKAIEHGVALVKAGADILDVGGESTRPGSARVRYDEELRRVLPVIRGLKRAGVPISIDTSKAQVAEQALEAGAVMVNDVSGLRFDPELATVAARANAALCLMHMQGTPQTMQAQPSYEDVMEEVLRFLLGACARAQEAGVKSKKLLVDPGIGFGKTYGHNLTLLRRLADLRQLGHPVVVGTSRKTFLGAATGGKPVGERLWATLGSVAAIAAMGHADIMRVHDVAEVRDALAVADAVRQATEAGDTFRGAGRSGEFPKVAASRSGS